MNNFDRSRLLFGPYTARLAWRQLTETQRTKVIAILKKHAHWTEFPSHGEGSRQPPTPISASRDRLVSLDGASRTALFLKTAPQARSFCTFPY